MKVAVVQMTTRRDVSQNLEKCEAFIHEAKQGGAEWIVFPENVPYLGKDQEKLEFAQEVDGEYVSLFTKWALENKVWLTIGAFPETGSATHTYNTQVTISPEGELVSVYRKIHLFDVELPNLVIRESDSILPGKDLVVMDLEDFKVGCTICYDLRFPEMYRKLTTMGANVFVVPSAFTKRTGAAHWHALLKARAIENQAYVIAPNQFGHHFDDRYSFGGSVIYDPWGTQIVCAEEKECVIFADVNIETIRKTRTEMPVLQHRIFNS